MNYSLVGIDIILQQFEIEQHNKNTNNILLTFWKNPEKTKL